MELGSLEQSEDSLEVGKVTWSSLSQSKEKSKHKERNLDQSSELKKHEAPAQRIVKVKDETRNKPSEDTGTRDSEEALKEFEKKLM